MYKAIKEWLTTKPATKAGWFGGIIAMFALLVNTCVLLQNSETIEQTRNLILLSMDPSIDVIFRADSAFVLNTTSVDLLDIRLNPIAYSFKGSPPRIVSRNQPGGDYPLVDTLHPREKIPIPIEWLVPYIGPRYDIASDTVNAVRVAVLTFRRDVDLKRFVRIEVFRAAQINGKLSMFALYSGKNTASDGPPDMEIEILTTIEQVEKRFFKAESFQ